MNDLNRRRFLGAATVASVVGGVAASPAAEPGSRSRKIKILGIGCSPRPESTTAAAVQACLEAAHAVQPDRIDIELITLAGKRIDGAVAAGIPLAAEEPDDFLPLVPKLGDPAVAGLIIGSPVYFGNMSSLCKAFLERLMTFRKDGFKLSNQVAGVLAVGGARNGGQELTIRSIQTALFCQEMIVVGESRPTAHFGPGFWNSDQFAKITDDPVGTPAGVNLGRRVAEVALMIG